MISTRTMTPLLALAALVWVALPAAHAEEAEQLAVDALLERVQAHYESVADYVADFRQVYESAALGEERTSAGRVFFRKPGQMRWDYAGPQERYLISDGSTLWVYEPAFGQYYQESLRDSQLPVALRFLMGEGRLADDFTAAAGPGAPDGEAWLVLRPRRSEGQFRELRLRIETASGRVREVVIFDPLGNVNRLHFSGVRENVGLPGSGFRFEAPEGARRVEGPGR